MTPRSYSAIRLSLLAVVMTCAMPAFAGDQTVGQAKKAFTVRRAQGEGRRHRHVPQRR